MLKMFAQAANVGAFLVSGGSLAVGVVALNVGVTGINCAPAAYCKATLSGGETEHVADPKFRVKFGNASFGAMFVHEMFYEIDGRRSQTLAPALEKVTSAKLCTESTGLMASDRLKEPRAWKHGGFVTLATMRPTTTGKDCKWDSDVAKALSDHNTTLVVVTSIAPGGIAEYFTKKTSRIKLASV